MQTQKANQDKANEAGLYSAVSITHSGYHPKQTARQSATARSLACTVHVQSGLMQKAVTLNTYCIGLRVLAVQRIRSAWSVRLIPFCYYYYYYIYY